MWCIPPAANAEFVYHMEDVLDVYHRPADPQHPVVCLDEATKQLIGEVREPLPAKPGEVERCDCEYVRNGTATLFVAVDPLAGWREVTVTDHRCRTNWAHFVKELLDGPAVLSNPTRSTQAAGMASRCLAMSLMPPRITDPEKSICRCPPMSPSGSLNR